jgi:histidine transport system permease protein
VIDIIQEYWRNYLYSDGYHWTGAAVTLWLLLVSTVLGLVLAVPLAVARASSRKWLSGPVWFYTYIFRGTPLYVQLLICYSGIYSLDFVRDTPTLSSFFRSGMNCVLLAFVLHVCAYNIEIFAGAIKATSHGEIEAARAFGMGGLTLYRRVILPSALRRALPAYSNEVVMMMHATSLAFTATVPEILKVARDVNSATYQAFNAFGLAAALYACLAFVLIWGFRRMEARWLAYLKPLRH